jgi:CBS-domain-containing membrane protein
MLAYENQRTVVSTVGGTLISLFVGVNYDDVMKTAVLAFVGAVVSFIASMFMRWLTRRLMK